MVKKDIMASVSFRGRGPCLRARRLCIVQTAIDGAVQCGQGDVAQLLGPGDGIHRAGLERVGGSFVGAGGHPHDGLIHTDDARQAHRAAPAGQNTQLGFRQAYFGDVLITRKSQARQHSRPPPMAKPLMATALG